MLEPDNRQPPPCRDAGADFSSESFGADARPGLNLIEALAAAPGFPRGRELAGAAKDLCRLIRRQEALIALCERRIEAARLEIKCLDFDRECLRPQRGESLDAAPGRHEEPLPSYRRLSPPRKPPRLEAAAEVCGLQELAASLPSDPQGRSIRRACEEAFSGVSVNFKKLADSWTALEELWFEQRCKIFDRDCLAREATGPA